MQWLRFPRPTTNDDGVMEDNSGTKIELVLVPCIRRNSEYNVKHLSCLACSEGRYRFRVDTGGQENKKLQSTEWHQRTPC